MLILKDRIFVATWNVAGKSPPSYLNLDEWLHTSPPADIYVLGYILRFNLDLIDVVDFSEYAVLC